jgi:hypothetical protein
LPAKQKILILDDEEDFWQRYKESVNKPFQANQRYIQLTNGARAVAMLDGAEHFAMFNN